MELVFRNYQNYRASIFELIDGSSEVKQTTALGYLLSQDVSFLRAFLKSKVLIDVIGNIKFNELSKTVVHTELKSNSGKRVDIAIFLYKKNAPYKALLIEAKSIKLNVSQTKVVSQIENYLTNEHFEDLDTFEEASIFGCILTRNSLVTTNTNIASLSWTDIIKLLNNEEGLAKEYLNFLMKMNGTMNFYEKEVYSIPAGKTYEFIKSYPFIYECPNIGKGYESMKKPLFLAFRKEQGVMERLFGVEDIIVINPHLDLISFTANSSYSDEVKKRINEYCKSTWGINNYPNEEKQFFILSLTNQIELKHNPKPEKNNSFRAYYKLSSLLNSKLTTLGNDDKDN